MPQISVIIPVYNGERYLHECIDSILSQTHSDLELILVDDGSRDSSPQICDEYARQDSRVRVVHKENEGVNATRCRGAREARGEWVTFCDCDDTMPADALASLYELHEDTDVVIGFLELPNHRRTLSLRECRENAITGRLLPPSPFAKLYRRSLVTPDVFDFPKEVFYGEDMIMNIRLMFRLTRAPRFCYKKVYEYRRNTSSVSHTSRASLDYEQLFDAVRARSIPDAERGRYMREILWSRVNGISSVAHTSPQDVAAGEHPYLVRLKADIRQYHYRLSPRQWLMLHSRSPRVVRLCGFVRIVGNFLRYRLGLNN